MSRHRAAADGTAAAALAGARSLGQQLLERSVEDAGGTTWLCPDPPPRVGDPVEWRLLESLYDGTAGIALFLGELAAVTGDERFRAATEGAVRWLLERSEATAADGCGLYLGRSSTCWALARWAQITGDGGLLQKAIERALRLAENVDEAGPSDLLVGRSGLLLLLANLSVVTGEPALEAPLGLAVESLALKARAGPEGLCWDRSPRSVHPLCGLAHGAAGIGLALIHAGSVSAAPGAVWLGRQALLYEEVRAAEAEGGRWPDLRRDDVFLDLDAHLVSDERQPAALVAQRSMRGWCAGPAGIGLARLGAYRLVGDEAYRRQAVRALELARRDLRLAEPPLDLTLCHGVCGEGELFLEAAEVLEEPRYLAVAEEIADALLRWEERAPGAWFRASGRDSLAGDPGLFLGAAGVGHFLLRVATRGAVPSVAAPAPRARTVRPSDGAEPSIAACRLAVLRATFPRVIEQLESSCEEDLAAYLGAQGDRGLAGRWEERFLAWASTRLEPQGRRAAALEWRKRQIDLETDGDAAAAFRALRRRRRASELVALPDDELLALRLRMSPEMELWAGSGDEEPRLLEPYAGGVRDVLLPVFARTVLAAYGEGREGAAVAAEVLAGFELAADARSELAARVASQVRAALTRGLLEEQPA